MEEGDNVVNEAETTAVESTTTEQTPEVTEETSEKTEIAPEGTDGEASEEEPKTVPYDRFKEVNEEAKRVRDLEKQLERYKAQAEIVERFQKASQAEEIPEPLKRADQQLQELKYLKEEQAREMIRQEIQANAIGDKLMSEMDSMERKYDGSDGSPKFVREDVADFLDSKGFQPEDLASGKITLEEAYKLMYGDKLVDLKAKQKRGTAASEKPGKPMASADTSTKADFEEAKKSGDWSKVIWDRVKSPYRT